MSEDIKAILNKPTCSVMDLQKIFGLSKTPVYKAIKDGSVRSFRIGGTIVVPTAPLRAKLGLTNEAAA